MSERGGAKGKENALASRAKPRLEERVCERGRRPTRKPHKTVEPFAEAARPRAIEGGRRRGGTRDVERAEAAE